MIFSMNFIARKPDTAATSIATSVLAQFMLAGSTALSPVSRSFSDMTSEPRLSRARSS